MPQEEIISTVYAILKSRTFASAVTGIVAFFAGHFVAVYRDKRKEFNIAADRLAEALHRGSSGEIAFVEFENFSRFLRGRTLRKYRKALKRYAEASQRQEKTFDGTINLGRRDTLKMRDANAAESYFRELASFTKRK